VTVRADTAVVITRPSPEAPLASFVLRVVGRPATLRYELHDLRTGQRHRFSRSEALVAFLRERGLPEPDAVAPGVPPAA
jgi:hypothetical protein